MTCADAEQAVAEALGAVIDTDIGIVAITARATDNIAPADDLAVPPTIGLTYDVGPTAERDTIGEHYDVPFTITAEAPDRATCRALLGAAQAALTVAAFRAAGADAVVDGPVQTTGVTRGQSAQSDDAERPRETFAGAIDGTIWFTPA